jgi:hypothetical protein
MTTKVRCVLCGSLFDSGTASKRAADFNRHRCNQMKPVDQQVSAPVAVLGFAALIVGLMVFNWLAIVLASSDWFTPVAVFIVIMAAGVTAYKLTERNPR